MPDPTNQDIAQERPKPFVGISYRSEVGRERGERPYDLVCTALHCDEAVPAAGTDGTPLIACPRCASPMCPSPFGRAVRRA